MRRIKWIEGEPQIFVIESKRGSDGFQPVWLSSLSEWKTFKAEKKETLETCLTSPWGQMEMSFRLVRDGKVIDSFRS